MRVRGQGPAGQHSASKAIRYLRSLFTAGALVMIRYAKIHGTGHRPWLAGLLARRPTKVAAIAPATTALNQTAVRALKFFVTLLKLFCLLQIFWSPQSWRPGCLRGPESRRAPEGVRCQLVSNFALWRIWL